MGAITPPPPPLLPLPTIPHQGSNIALTEWGITQETPSKQSNISHKSLANSSVGEGGP